MAKALRIFFAIFLIYFAIRLFILHFQDITFPYPITQREGALQATTSLLLQGKNPYSEEVQPQYTNIYGIIYPLMVTPLVSIWGNSLNVHRAVTAFFIFASCLLVFLVLYRRKVPFLINASAILMLYAALIYPATTTPCVDPAATGLFFMLLAVFIPYLLEYSYKSIVLSVVAAIFAFYSKPYFLVGMPIVVSYLFLFISQKKSFVYGALLVVLFGCSIVFVDKILPMYFSNCFFTHSNYAQEWASAQQLESQLKSFSYLHIGILILMALSVFWYFWRRKGRLATYKDIVLSPLKQIQWRLDVGLLKFSCPIEAYAGLCTLILLVLFLGKNSGATLWYFFQLFSPFFLMVAAELASLLSLWWAAPLLVFNLFLFTAGHTFHKEIGDWPQVKALITSQNRILCSPFIAPILIQENREIFDDGQSEYFVYGAKRKGIWGSFLKEDQRVYKAMYAYLSRFQQKVINKEFDVLVISGCPPYITESIKKSYKPVGSFSLYAHSDRVSYTLTVWVPASR